MKLLQTVLILILAAQVAQAEDVPPPNPEAVAAIKALGGNVMAIAQNDPHLDVTLHLADKEVTDEALTQVGKLSNVIWLNLARTKITDAGLASIHEMKTLEKFGTQLLSRFEALLLTSQGMARVTVFLNMQTMGCNTP